MGHDCKYYTEGAFYTDKSGNFAAAKDTSGGMVQLPIITTINGKFVENARWNRIVLMDIAVATCFCHHPQIGQRMMVQHKDGDKNNCASSNLSWVPYHYQTATAPVTNLNVNKSICTITSGGQISVDGNVVHPMYYYNDKATGLKNIQAPFVYTKAFDGVHMLRENIDDLMARAGYVNGDDANFANPVVLHKDNNWMNFVTNNLEWCDASDPRYQQYLDQRKQDMIAMFKKKNPGKNIPNGWFV